MENQEVQESPIPEKVVHPLLGFVQAIPSLFPSGDVKKHFRILQNGFFVTEQFVDQMFAGYVKFRNESSGEQQDLSQEKLVKKFFNTTNPKLYYLLDGKICLSGYFVEGDFPKNTIIPFSHSVLADASTSLNPKDEFLNAIEGFNVYFDSVKGYTFQCLVSEKKYSLTQDFIKAFSKIIPNALRIDLAQNAPLRDYISKLVAVLGKVQEVKENQRILVPRKFAGKTFNLLKHESMVFVSDANNALVFCYALHKKPFQRMIEAEEITSKTTIRKIEDGKWKYASIKNKHGMYTASLDFVLSFLAQIPKSPKLRKKFQGRYTLGKCLDELVAMLEAGVLVVRANEDPKAKDKEIRYIKNGLFRFYITGKNVLSSLEEKFPKPKDVSVKNLEIKAPVVEASQDSEKS